MWKKLGLGVLCTAALAACGDDKPQAAQQPDCADPAVTQTAQSYLQQLVKDQARQFAAADQRGFVDADKVVAAAADMVVRLEQPAADTQGAQGVCQGRLTITLPANAVMSAQTNAPLLYGDVPLAQIVAQRLSGSSVQHDGNGVFSQTLRYTPQKGSDGQLMLTYADNTLPAAANAVAAALLPYGVKDILVVNGQTMSREDALHRVQQGAQVEVLDELPPQQDVLGEFIASQASAGEMPAEVLAPGRSQPQDVPFDAADLDQAKAANSQAREEINAQWERMDKAVQQGLLEEQRAWIRKRDDSCRQAAAPAGSELQAEYLYLQCGTRMTRERIQYLKGYSIN